MTLVTSIQGGNTPSSGNVMTAQPRIPRAGTQEQNPLYFQHQLSRQEQHHLQQLQQQQQQQLQHQQQQVAQQPRPSSMVLTRMQPQHIVAQRVEPESQGQGQQQQQQPTKSKKSKGKSSKSQSNASTSGRANSLKPAPPSFYQVLLSPLRKKGGSSSNLKKQGMLHESVVNDQNRSPPARYSSKSSGLSSSTISSMDSRCTTIDRTRLITPPGLEKAKIDTSLESPCSPRSKRNSKKASDHGANSPSKEKDYELAEESITSDDVILEDKYGETHISAKLENMYEKVKRPPGEAFRPICANGWSQPSRLKYQLILAHLQNKYPSYNILGAPTLYRNARSSSEASNSTSAQNTRAGSGQTNTPTTTASISQSSGQPGRHHTLPHHHNQHPFFYPSNFVPSSLFDDDPGIMSEVETSATGFRRSIKSRSSLPIVRTPSKTQDRSLGLVFLQYRNETKRALLPNEITSMDTVKALFVRSFPKQLTMDYLDSRHVRIYIHDPAKDMFYELEDLRDIRDRSVLRIYEQDVVNGAWLPVGGATPVAPQPGTWMDNDPSYFSEPEFDSEYQNQHIHRARKAGSPTSIPSNAAQSQYYGTVIMAPQYRGQPMPGRNYPQANARGPLPKQPPQPPERTKPFPERRLPGGENVGTGGRSSFPPPGYNMSYDDVYGNYGSRSGSTTPVVDEEARIRMEQMERQLASLTGLVQKALVPGQQPPRTGPPGSDQRDKPSKPAPPPKPASLVGYRGSADGSSVVGSLHINAEMFNQLRQLKKKTKDLRVEVRNLKRMAQSQATIAKDTLKETCLKIKASLAFMNIGDPVERQLRFERLKLCRDEESYKSDVSRLEKDLSLLESQVEELRSNVINRRCRVNMTDVESMALVLSRASKTVADLKSRYPHLQEVLKTVMAQEMEYVVREEKFLKSEPDRLESALRRCKKLTGTLVTLKRLASVQEQRSTGAHPGAHIEKSVSADSAHDVPNAKESTAARTVDVEPHTIIQVTPATPTLKSSSSDPRHENALDALLDELQTFSKPVAQADGQKRKFGSFDSGKKTVPLPPPRSSSRVTDPQEQARQLMLLSSLTAAAALANSKSGQTPAVVRSNSEPSPAQMQQMRPRSTPPENLKSASNESMDSQDGNPFAVIPSASITSLSSVDSQGSVIENGKGGKSRQQLLEERHQELLKKQKLLQEQYTRLQLLSRGQIPKTLLNDLKKTGSESNILTKSMTVNAVSGSLTHLAMIKQEDKKGKEKVDGPNSNPKEPSAKTTSNSTIKHETQKIYETDIL